MKNLPDKIYAYIPEDDIVGTASTKKGVPHQYVGIEYVRKDAFIEKACDFLYNYNQKQVLKHGARATLGCGEYTINVDEFRKYMKGE